MKFNFTLLLLIISIPSLRAQEEGFEFINQPMTIVVLGSSTAEGMGTSPLDSAWVNRFRVFAQKFNPNNQVINLAKGGYNTYKLMPTDFVSPRNRPNPDTERNITKALEYSPDLVIVNLPSNDIAGGYSVREQLSNFRQYKATLSENGVDLWVTTTQARNFPRQRDRLLQRDIKDSLYAIFPEHCIDFWSGLCDQDFRVLKEYDYGDGCHLNNGAHKVLMDRVLESKEILANLYATSLVREIPKKPQEGLPPHHLLIGFKGKLEFDSTIINVQRFVKITQENQIIDSVEVNAKSSKYRVESIVDLRLPVFVEFESPRGLTKVVQLNFEGLTKEDYPLFVYYPIEDLSMVEVSTEKLNYRFPNNYLIVAKFAYDSKRMQVRLDSPHVATQRQRIEEARIQPPAKGKKLIIRWENGKKKNVLKFKNGKLNGKSKWYNENGKKARFVTYQDGTYHGKYIDFNSAGKKQTLRIFENNEQIVKLKASNKV